MQRKPPPGAPKPDNVFSARKFLSGGKGVKSIPVKAERGSHPSSHPFFGVLRKGHSDGARTGSQSPLSMPPLASVVHAPPREQDKLVSMHKLSFENSKAQKPSRLGSVEYTKKMERMRELDLKIQEGIKKLDVG